MYKQAFVAVYVRTDEMLLHCGATANSGHYTAVVRAAGQWFVRDDMSGQLPSWTASCTYVSIFTLPIPGIR